MKNGISALTALLFIASLVIAQPHPNILWTQTYGGSNDDKGWSVQQTIDGGYVMAGWTWSYGVGVSDYYLVKTNSQGIRQWTRTFGGYTRDEAYWVEQTLDGGYILTGFTQSFGAGGGELWLVKTDWQGNRMWDRTYGGPLDGDGGRCVQQTKDGGYIAAGNVASFGAGSWDMYLLRTDALGNLIWQRAFGGTSQDYATSVRETSDGGCIVVGITYSFGSGGADIYVVRTDHLGHPLWSRTFGGSANEMGNSAIETEDGGFIIAGWTYSFGEGSADLYLAKTNSQGATEWTRTYGGSGFDGACTIHQTEDGGYIVGAYSSSVSAGSTDFLLLKLAANGDPEWKRTYGGGSGELWGCAEPTTDGGYVIGGWTYSYGSGVEDFFLVKTGPEDIGLGAESARIVSPSQFVLYPNYPNPFNSSTTIRFDIGESGHATLTLFDPLGREVAVLVNGVLSAGSHTVSWDASGLASGVYLSRLESGDYSETQKMVLVK